MTCHLRVPFAWSPKRWGFTAREARLSVEDVTREDTLLRRFLPGTYNDDGTVLSSAYKKRGKPDPEPSVELERRTTIEAAWERRPRSVNDGEGWAIGALSASVPIAEGLAVRHRPVDDNDAHYVIVDERVPSPLSPRLHCRLLANGTRVAYPPDKAVKGV